MAPRNPAADAAARPQRVRTSEIERSGDPHPSCYIVVMSKFTERAAAALELLPEEMQETAVAYLIEQGEKFRVLEAMIQEGVDDVEAGRVSAFDMDEIRALAREMAKNQTASEA